MTTPPGLTASSAAARALLACHMSRSAGYDSISTTSARAGTSPRNTSAASAAAARWVGAGAPKKAAHELVPRVEDDVEDGAQAGHLAHARPSRRGRGSRPRRAAPRRCRPRPPSGCGLSWRRRTRQAGRSCCRRRSPHMRCGATCPTPMTRSADRSSRLTSTGMPEAVSPRLDQLGRLVPAVVEHGVVPDDVRGPAWPASRRASSADGCRKRSGSRSRPPAPALRSSQGTIERRRGRSGVVVDQDQDARRPAGAATRSRRRGPPTGCSRAWPIQPRPLRDGVGPPGQPRPCSVAVGHVDGRDALVGERRFSLRGASVARGSRCSDAVAGIRRGPTLLM